MARHHQCWTCKHAGDEDKFADTTLLDRTCEKLVTGVNTCDEYEATEAPCEGCKHVITTILHLSCNTGHGKCIWYHVLYGDRCGEELSHTHDKDLFEPREEPKEKEEELHCPRCKHFNGYHHFDEMSITTCKHDRRPRCIYHHEDGTYDVEPSAHDEDLFEPREETTVKCRDCVHAVKVHLDKGFANPDHRWRCVCKKKNWHSLSYIEERHCDDFEQYEPPNNNPFMYCMDCAWEDDKATNNEGLEFCASQLFGNVYCKDSWKFRPKEILRDVDEKKKETTYPGGTTPTIDDQANKIPHEGENKVVVIAEDNTCSECKEKEVRERYNNFVKVAAFIVNEEEKKMNETSKCPQCGEDLDDRECIYCPACGTMIEKKERTNIVGRIRAWWSARREQKRLIEYTELADRYRLLVDNSRVMLAERDRLRDELTETINYIDVVVRDRDTHIKELETEIRWYEREFADFSNDVMEARVDVKSLEKKIQQLKEKNEATIKDRDENWIPLANRVQASVLIDNCDIQPRHRVHWGTWIYDVKILVNGLSNPENWVIFSRDALPKKENEDD